VASPREAAKAAPKGGGESQDDPCAARRRPFWPPHPDGRPLLPRIGEEGGFTSLCFGAIASGRIQLCKAQEPEVGYRSMSASPSAPNLTFETSRCRQINTTPL